MCGVSGKRRAQSTTGVGDRSQLATSEAALAIHLPAMTSTCTGRIRVVSAILAVGL